LGEQGTNGLQNSLVTQVWTLLRGNRGYAILEASLSFLAGLVEASILTLVAQISVGFVQGSDLGEFLPLVGSLSNEIAVFGLGAMVLLRFALLELSVVVNAKINVAVTLELRGRVAGAYASASWEKQEDLSGGSLHQLLVMLPTEISSQMSHLLTQFGYFIMTVAMVAYSVFLDPVITLVLLLGTAAITAGFGPLRKKIKRDGAIQLRRERELALLSEEFEALRYEVKVFGVSHNLEARVKESGALEQVSARRIHLLKGSVMPIYSSVSYGAICIILALLVIGGSADAVSAGPIVLVLLRSLSYGQGLQAAAAGLASLGPKIELLDSDVSALERSELPRGDRTVGSFGNVMLEAVRYSYPRADSSALHSLSLVIERGERVGIMGASGSGKTTLGRMILGVVSPSDGQVHVNGVPLRDVSEPEFAKLVGVVPQDPKVLRGSVADNLRLFRTGISDEALWSALEIADLADEVRSFDLGLETVLGTGGRGLSGGQRQRLGIARAVAGAPEILLMDEPTSSIDSTSERLVAEAITRLPGTITLIVVSHRIGIFESCERIVIIDGGEVVFDGPTESALRFTAK